MYSELGDQTKEDMLHLANLINCSDVIINTISTLSLDAACLDKPIICTASGRTANSPEAHYHETSYYKRLLTTGGVELVYTKEELEKSINNYLIDPLKNSCGRDLLRKRLCYKLDGCSGKRVADFLFREMRA